MNTGISDTRLSRRALILSAGAMSAFALSGCMTSDGGLYLSDHADMGFDLWAGAPGARFGDPIDVRHGSRRIHGPFEWTHPVTGENMIVYARRNQESYGEKVQYLTLREDGTALARVFDSRPGTGERTFVGDAFFPMGVWLIGKRRRYKMVEHTGPVARVFTVQLRVRKSGMAYEGVQDSVQYDWLARDVSDTKVFHERYVYSPGVGLADFDNRMA